MSQRNVLVSEAVVRALGRIDHFLSGGRLQLPSAEHRRACEALLDGRRASVRVAALFLAFYWLQDEDWNRDAVPVGIRGQHGDKLLSEQLTRRQITLHDNITAFAENLGWKGNVRNVHLLRDPRFQDFLDAIADAAPNERKRIADFLASRFADSRRESAPLPPVGADVLTFARAKQLFYNLLAISSEGHVQQFLVAALLHEYRRRHAIEVVTHHPHAADKYDDTAGDIEERQDERLLRAYEVTVRPDWQNRISNFQTKMDRFGLSKYVIIAAGVNDDPHWAEPAELALRLEPYGRDIAVVDLRDVVNFLAAELVPDELRAAVNLGYEYVSNHKLCGKEDVKAAYRDAVSNWLDSIGPTGAGGGDGEETA